MDDLKIVVSLNEGTGDTVEGLVTINGVPVGRLPEIAKPDNADNYTQQWKLDVFGYLVTVGLKALKEHGYDEKSATVIESDKAQMYELTKQMKGY